MQYKFSYIRINRRCKESGTFTKNELAQHILGSIARIHPIAKCTFELLVQLLANSLLNNVPTRSCMGMLNVTLFIKAKPKQTKIIPCSWLGDWMIDHGNYGIAV